MKTGIGCDHAGLELKLEIMSLLGEMGVDCLDYGTDTPQSVDYPDFGERVSGAVASHEIDRGILICGTGIGMSIVANKFPGVRASLCNDLFTAKMSRLHNDANVLVMGGRIVGKDLAKEIVKVWFSTAFEGGRHMRRVDKISRIEGKISGAGYGTGTAQMR
jgi:ribose 5-phosphate isomerase B